MDGKNSMTKSHIIIIFLLAVIIVLLFTLTFRDRITWYFKSQEILRHASVLNIPEVAGKCVGYYLGNDAKPSGSCKEVHQQYSIKAERWNELIKENRKLSCNDFESRKEANLFYQYISGELAHDFYTTAEKNLEKGEELPTSFAFISDKKTICRYDPYGLNTDSDCNACENY